MEISRCDQNGDFLEIVSGIQYVLPHVYTLVNVYTFQKECWVRVDL